MCAVLIKVELRCIENLFHVFTEMKLQGLIPNSSIHVSVSNLYIPFLAAEK